MGKYLICYFIGKFSCNLNHYCTESITSHAIRKLYGTSGNLGNVRREKALNVTSTVVYADLTTPVMEVWFLVIRQIDQYCSVAKEVKRLDLFVAIYCIARSCICKLQYYCIMSLNSCIYAWLISRLQCTRQRMQ